MRKQDGVYWPLASDESGGVDFDDYGQPQWADPIPIKCRWDDAVEEFIGPDGTRELSKAKVYVDCDVDIGGVLMLGEIADIVEPVNIKENEGAWEIRGFLKNPNLRATEFLRTAIL